MHVEYYSALRLSLSPCIRKGTRWTHNHPPSAGEKWEDATNFQLYFGKVFFDLFLFTCPFDCSDIRHIGNNDYDDYKPYVTFVGVSRILLPCDIRAETEETVEN